MTDGSLGTSVSALLAAATIVVLDDHADNVTLLDRVLRSAGATNVHGFTDPRAAIDACRAQVPDLALVDLHMPQLDGLEVLRELRAAVPDDVFLPVVVLTADVTPAARRNALAAGAKDFLTKPFDVTEVLLRVGNLLETGALYQRLGEHTAALQHELEAREAADRAAEVERAERLRRIDEVLVGEGLRVVFQPIVDLRTSAVVGAEALARFAGDPPKPPNEWFAEAAEVGRGLDLELRAVELALGHLDDLPPGAFLSVNASPGTICEPAFADLLSATAGERVVVEVTEHDRIDDYAPIEGALVELRRHGARVAVDDTGAGYASLSHILRLQADILKLDIGLTRGIDGDPVRRALASALVTFAGTIGSQIVAEGVETGGELAELRELGVPWAQGYHLRRPGPLPLPLELG